MKVQFTLSAEDVIVVGRYSYDHCPIPYDSSKKWRRIIIGAGILIFILQLLQKNYSFRNNIFYFALIVLIGVFWPAVFKTSCKWLLYLCKYKNFPFEPIEYEITVEGLLFSEKKSRTLLRWDGIGDIIFTDGYTFLRIQSGIGHVFPENKFPPGEYSKFTSELMLKWKNRKTAV